jgi:Beta propeller domain
MSGFGVAGRFVAAAVPAACVVLLLSAGGTAAPRSPEQAGSLREFRGCAEIARYAREHRRALPYSYPDQFAEAAPNAAGRAEAPADESGAGAPAFSGTNVQEEGVDEPDVLKTDGRTIFAIRGGSLLSIDASAAEPRVLDSVRLDSNQSGELEVWPQELLLAGDRVLVLASGWRGEDWLRGARTLLIEVDAGDPADLRISETLEVEGSYLSGRLNGSTARVVLSSSPEYPVGAEFRRRLSDRIPRPNWLPSIRIVNRDTGVRSRRPLLDCSKVRRPARFSGLEMLSVLTVDLGAGLRPSDVDSVMTGGKTVYGSDRALYVATERWLRPEADPARVSEVSTAIHRFDLVSPTQTEYAASGEVPGYMLSQWSMSEHDGYLRVASTSAPPWEGRQTADSQSFVTVLDAEGGLDQAGQVSGLGPTERIYAVRFIGEVGYVVTFRQIDPLYTIDISSPTDPTVVGELKVPGYSAYLHPVGDGLLLGIGQDASGDGNLRGAQATLFDVSDPGRPVEVERLQLGGSSDVEYDHRAFLYWEPKELAVMPLQVWGDRARPEFSGAVGLRAGPESGLQEVARISHPHAAWIERSTVIGDALHTLSERGLLTSDLDTLQARAWLPLEPR